MSITLTQSEAERRIKGNFAQTIELISEYKSRRNRVKLHCLECGYIWDVVAANVLYLQPGTKAHYCPHCGNNPAKTNRIYLNCSYCGKEIFRCPCELKKNKSGFFYCSKKCGNLHKNQIRKENGEWNNSQDYRAKAFEIYPHQCAVCGYNEDYRILEVHHIDMNRDNNSIENLIILCPNCHRKITLKYYRLIIDDKRDACLVVL